MEEKDFPCICGKSLLDHTNEEMQKCTDEFVEECEPKENPVTGNEQPNEERLFKQINPKLR